MYRERDKGAGKEAKRRLILHRITHDEKRGTMASFAGSSEEQAEAAAVLQRVEERCDAAESAVNAMLPQFEAFGMTDLHGAVLADHEAHASDTRPIIANLVAAVRALRDAEAAREVAERNAGDASSVSAVVLKQLIEDSSRTTLEKIDALQAFVDKRIDARMASIEAKVDQILENTLYARKSAARHTGDWVCTSFPPLPHPFPILIVGVVCRCTGAITCIREDSSYLYIIYECPFRCFLFLSVFRYFHFN